MINLLYTSMGYLPRTNRFSRLLSTKQYKRFSTTSTNPFQDRTKNTDELITALNGAQDITVKAISCRTIINDYIKRLNLTPQSTHPFAELITCGILLGSNLKGEETLQINFAGEADSLMKNIMVIVDGSLKVKGTVGNTQVSIDDGNRPLSIPELFGNVGQIQVVKNHPFWKQPTSSIVSLDDYPIPINLSLYISQSEQRRGVFITDIVLEGKVCKQAAAVFVECLPGCPDETVEKTIENLREVDRKRLSSYFSEGAEDEEALNKILDDCLVSMEADGIRWNSSPRFHCQCNTDRIWRALDLLPKNDIEDMIQEDKGLEVWISYLQI